MLNVINDKNIRVPESEKSSDVDKAILETLKLVVPKTTRFTESDLKEITKRVKDKLNKDHKELI